MKNLFVFILILALSANFHSHLVQASEMTDEKIFCAEVVGSSNSSFSVDAEKVKIQQIGAAIKEYVQYDCSCSSVLQQGAEASLVNEVVYYMKVGHGQALLRLFYEPNVDAWSALYEKVTNRKDFSAITLVTLLDKTRESILNAYREVPTEACFWITYSYFCSLLNQVITEIYGGCWGFSADPISVDVVDQLKSVYCRSVVGLLNVGELTLDEKVGKAFRKFKEEGRSAEVAHYEVLMECIGVATYGFMNNNLAKSWSSRFQIPDQLLEDVKDASKFIKGINEREGTSIAIESFQKTMALFSSNNRFDGIMLGSAIIEVISPHILNLGKLLNPNIVNEDTMQYSIMAKHTLKDLIGFRKKLRNITKRLTEEGNSRIRDDLLSREWPDDYEDGVLLRTAILLPGDTQKFRELIMKTFDKLVKTTQEPNLEPRNLQSRMDKFFKFLFNFVPAFDIFNDEEQSKFINTLDDLLKLYALNLRKVIQDDFILYGFDFKKNTSLCRHRATDVWDMYYTFQFLISAAGMSTNSQNLIFSKMLQFADFSLHELDFDLHELRSSSIFFQRTLDFLMSLQKDPILSQETKALITETKEKVQNAQKELSI